MRRSIVATIAKAALTLALLAWLLWRVDWREALGAIITLAPAVVAIGTLAGIAQTWLASIRWSLLVRDAQGGVLPVWPATRFFLIGNFFGQFLLNTVGSDAVRGYLAYRYGLPGRVALSGIALDRYVGLLTLGLLVACGSPILLGGKLTNTLGLAALIAFAALAGMLLMLLALQRVLPARPGGPLLEALRAVVSGAHTLVRNPVLAARLIALSLAANLSNVAVALLLSRALGIELAPAMAFAVIPAVILVSVLPVSIAGWGVREGAMVAAFRMIGLDDLSALKLSLCLGVLQAAAAMPGGLLCFTHWRDIVAFRRQRVGEAVAT